MTARKQSKVGARLAIDAIRHVVQDHGNDGTHIGGAIDGRNMRAVGKLVGLQFPESYFKILTSHNGILVAGTGPVIYSFAESIECFSLYADDWKSPTTYWPIGDDECGNHYVFALSMASANGEAPVAFLDKDGTRYWVASSYAHFIFFAMMEECAQIECNAMLPSERPQVESLSDSDTLRTLGWPSDSDLLRTFGWSFVADYVLRYDPDLSRVQPRDAWPT